ncbi:MAG: putative oxidoreductase YjhC [Candidatus Moanabacter tarae]|uniref:Putative oxidoreductase YjhC n=1 Tax=Candidatus Moanibacter tarae TaxID=2200854 RepID=A0A2Z4AG79_9BACT|nr:MAG: putative oxidoreductase YjhC [Candidatus Moanabacter tarae]
MHNSYSIGLIGCGTIAPNWIKAVSQKKETNIELVYDLDENAATKRAGEANAKVASNLHEIITSNNINLVIVCTPTGSHPELVFEAARNKKHVMCEKPMALDLNSCKQMINACNENGVKLAIGHTLRFKDAFLTCRKMIAEGAIGSLVSGNIDRMAATQLPDASSSLPFGEKDPSHWRRNPRTSGGIALELFIHEIDITRELFGEVSSVMCEMSKNVEYDGLISPQLAKALVCFESGALVTMRTGGTVAMPTKNYWMAGTEGGLRFTEWGGPVEHYRHDLGKMQTVECESLESHYLELCDLINAIESRNEPENSGINGMRNVALALAMYQSCESGRRIEFTDGIPIGMPFNYRNTQW